MEALRQTALSLITSICYVWFGVMIIVVLFVIFVAIRDGISNYKNEKKHVAELESINDELFFDRVQEYRRDFD